ncbi:MAG: adenosylhomocysteinase [bacterium]
MPTLTCDIADKGLHAKGHDRIEWAYKEMPVLQQIEARFRQSQPLKGLRMAACLHVTSETANLARVLKAGGAEVALCASNPLSTQDDVAASLVEDFGIAVFAIHGADRDLYYRHINGALDIEPHLTMDDGADTVAVVHNDRRGLLDTIIGGTEETTTGVVRLRQMAAEGALGYPIVAVNDAMTKHLFDNRYGTGQSTLDGLLRATNVLLAGKTFVVAGYGWCGKGLAQRARGLGALVVVTEVDPVKALEAIMDGFQVLTMDEAARRADFIVTLTGDCKIIDARHIPLLKDGVILANSGHFDSEINIPAIEAASKGNRLVRGGILREYDMGSKKILLAGEGRLINLAAAEGHPAAVMDMSFANQALCSQYMATEYKKLEKTVYSVPEAIDKEIAALKLSSMGVAIDVLTAEQTAYLTSWQHGT